MIRRRWLILAGIMMFIVIVGLVARNQIKVYNNRQMRANEARVRQSIRQSLFDMLQPVALKNCELERFGEANDGGYLMCGNLLGDARAGYSYGIGGYDKWGCDISTRLQVTVHQYDCFNTSQPSCPSGQTVFHPECVGGVSRTEEGRFFDTIRNHFAKNGDSDRQVVLKIDVEGAEWDSFLATPDDVLDHIEQIAVEFHGTEEGRYERVVRRLRQFFYVAHLHFNNGACVEGIDPFPAWAYEVLFVNKRLTAIDPSRRADGLHPLDALNAPSWPDCQPKTDRRE